MGEKISIVIADDHAVFREGLRRMIDNTPGLQVVGEAADGDTALNLVRELKPAMVFLDISMPGRNGFEVARAMSDENISVPIVFLTMHSEKAMYEEALDLGAKGYVLKYSAATDIHQSILAVTNGRHFVSPELTATCSNGNGAGPYHVVTQEEDGEQDRF